MRTKITLVILTSASESIAKMMLEQVQHNPMLMALAAKTPFKVEIASTTIEPIGGGDGSSQETSKA